MKLFFKSKRVENFEVKTRDRIDRHYVEPLEIIEPVKTETKKKKGLK